MADVTKPGEGPPPLGHAVDKKTLPLGGPIWGPHPGAWGNKPALPHEFSAGTILRVDTPVGRMDVVARGDVFVVVKGPKDFPAGARVLFDDNFMPHVAPSPSPAKVDEFVPYPKPGYAKDREKDALDSMAFALQSLAARAAAERKDDQRSLADFLNKAGPSPDEAERRRKLCRNLAAAKAELEAAERAAVRRQLHEVQDYLDSLAKAAEEGPTPPASPQEIRPGRPGRAIELDD